MTIDELVAEFQDERDRLFKRYEEEREAFARNWLLARGWDGKDMEQARKLAEGWIIEHKLEDGKLTLTMVKDDTEGEEQMKAEDIVFNTNRTTNCEEPSVVVKHRMTNYEKIKNMSIEEMTKVFCHGDNGSCRDCPIAEDSQLCLDAQDVIKNWLEEDTEK